MRLSLSMKVGLVSLFSCLALLLGLFSSTGMASAHTAQTPHSQCTQVLQTKSVAGSEDERISVVTVCDNDSSTNDAPTNSSGFVLPAVPQHDKD